MDRFTLLTLQSIMGLGNFVFGDLYRRYVCFHEIFRLFLFHCFMQPFVYILSVFTPYVAAFLLNEPGYNAPPAPTENYGDDPIVIVDLVGKKNVKKIFII